MSGNDSNNEDARGFRENAFRDDNLRDGDLRARFAELRREEELQTPEFAFPSPNWARQGFRWSAGRLIAGALCLVTIMGAVFLLVPLRPAPKPGRPLSSLAEWRSPTDFLLETPGRELLRTVPAIGAWQDYTKGSSPGQKQRQKHPQVRKQALP